MKTTMFANLDACERQPSDTNNGIIALATMPRPENSQEFAMSNLVLTLTPQQLSDQLLGNAVASPIPSNSFPVPSNVVTAILASVASDGQAIPVEFVPDGGSASGTGDVVIYQGSNNNDQSSAANAKALVSQSSQAYGSVPNGTGQVFCLGDANSMLTNFSSATDSQVFSGSGRYNIFPGSGDTIYGGPGTLNILNIPNNNIVTVIGGTGNISILTAAQTINATFTSGHNSYNAFGGSGGLIQGGSGTDNVDLDSGENYIFHGRKWHRNGATRGLPQLTRYVHNRHRRVYRTRRRQREDYWGVECGQHKPLFEQRWRSFQWWDRHGNRAWRI
jgi:hypothetical protein